MDISEVRKGSKIMIDGVPYNVEEAEFMKPGKGSAIYRYKLRNLIDGSSTIEPIIPEKNLPALMSTPVKDNSFTVRATILFS